MPFGLVVMRWDERIGAELLVKYPDEIIISDKTLLQVYSTHEYSGEAGMISLMIGSLNIASYYTGPEKGYYILLLLGLEDDPDSYEGGILDISLIAGCIIILLTSSCLMPRPVIAIYQLIVFKLMFNLGRILNLILSRAAFCNESNVAHTGFDLLSLPSSITS